MKLTSYSGPFRGFTKRLKQLRSALSVIGVGNSPKYSGQGKGVEYFVTFKKPPLIGKVFHNGKHILRVVDKEIQNRRCVCRVVPFNQR